MKKIFTILFIVFTSKFFAQKDTLMPPNYYEGPWQWGVRAGVGFNGTCELGLIRTYNWTSHLKTLTFSLSNEFVSSRQLLNPKISAEYFWLVFGGRISVIDYTNFVSNEIRIRPQIGFAAYGLVTFLFGHDVTLTDNTFCSVPEDAWYLVINIPLGKE